MISSQRGGKEKTEAFIGVCVILNIYQTPFVINNIPLKPYFRSTIQSISFITDPYGRS